MVEVMITSEGKQVKEEAELVVAVHVNKRCGCTAGAQYL